VSPQPADYPSSAQAEAAGAPPGQCRLVSSSAELSEHFAIRRQVFVEEQAMFAGSDRDGPDDDPATLHVIGLWDGHPAGTVRLYPLDDRGLWKGDRLAVLPASRSNRLGELLVRFAVSSARERGGVRMVAYIQPPNVAFFEHLGWSRVGDLVQYVGLPHQQMDISLAR
jgi:putative N-acetyltransferase (TIGR04045 family)